MWFEKGGGKYRGVGVWGVEGILNTLSCQIFKLYIGEKLKGSKMKDRKLDWYILL